MQSLIQALANAADGAFIIDKEQHIIYWNQAAQKILGYTPDQVAGQFCHELLDGCDEQERSICRDYCRMAMIALSGGTIKDRDICVRTNSGDLCWINMSTFTFSSTNNGTGPVLVHLFRDVTQKKQHERFIDHVLEAAKDLRDDHPIQKPSSTSAEHPIDLTPRESEVLSLLAQGLNPNDIAQSLSISPATVRNHIRNIRQKLHVHSQLEAVVYAFKHGLVTKA